MADLTSMCNKTCRKMIQIRLRKSTFFEKAGIWGIPSQKVLKMGSKKLKVKGYPFTHLFSRVTFLPAHFEEVLKKGVPKNGVLTLNPFRPTMSKKTSIFEDFWQKNFHFSKNVIFVRFLKVRAHKNNGKVVFFTRKHTSIRHMDWAINLS